MSHDKSPLEQAAELAFYGPLGLALAVKDALPGWVDLGRRRVGHRIEVARIVGEHASRYGQKKVTKTLVGLGILPGTPPPPRSPKRPAAAAPPGASAGNGAEGPGGGQAAVGSAAGASPDAESALAPAPTPARGSGPVAGRRSASPRSAAGGSVAGGSVAGGSVAGGSVAGGSGALGSEGPEGPASSSAELAIPGYDSLSAFQVVQRLAGLAPAELEAVRAYEAAGRGRRTILTKISQLQAGRT